MIIPIHFCLKRYCFGKKKNPARCAGGAAVCTAQKREKRERMSKIRDPKSEIRMVKQPRHGEVEVFDLIVLGALERLLPR